MCWLNFDGFHPMPTPAWVSRFGILRIYDFFWLWCPGECRIDRHPLWLWNVRILSPKHATLLNSKGFHDFNVGFFLSCGRSPTAWYRCDFFWASAEGFQKCRRPSEALRLPKAWGLRPKVVLRLPVKCLRQCGHPGRLSGRHTRARWNWLAPSCMFSHVCSLMRVFFSEHACCFSFNFLFLTVFGWKLRNV